MPSFRLIILLIILACVFISQVDAEHIIVAYDISGSMHTKANGQRVLYERDLDRLNNYLTQILFTGVSKSVDNRDQIILPFDSGPLYQNGDRLSYFRFATNIHNEFTGRQNVSTRSFVSRLPETSRYAGYQGQDTEFSKARVHIYEDLYHKDENTYWILVSDEDEDLSRGESKDPVLKTKLAKFEREFYQPPVFELMVNSHVTIRIRQIFRYERLRQSTSAVYVATSQNPNQPAQIVAFSKEPKTGVFRSEKLCMDTSNTEKSDFQLDSVEAQIVSEAGQPLFSLEKVSFNNISPPKRFQLKLPLDFPSGVNTQNQLQLAIYYRYRDEPKERSFSLSYTTIIDTLCLALKEEPDQPIDPISFVKKGDVYFNKEPLVLHSESPTPNKFQIQHITFAVTTRPGKRELYTEQIQMDSAKLPATLLLSIPADTKQFNNRTNVLALTVDYKYDGKPRKRPIIANYNIHTSPNILPFIILPVVIGLGIIGLIVWRKLPLSGYSGIKIKLTELTPTGTGRSDEFMLESGHTVYFRAQDSDSLDLSRHIFDVNCKGYLTFDGKDFLLNSPEYSDTKKLSDGQDFRLQDIDDSELYVSIRVEFVEDTSSSETPSVRDVEVDPFSNEIGASGEDAEIDPFNSGDGASDEDDPFST